VRARGRATVWALLLGLGVAPAALAFPDTPPPAHTGGFGEPDCSACHFGTPEARRTGRLHLEGVGNRFEPGGTYTLTLVLDARRAAAAGVQVSVRFADGRSAGALQAVDPDLGVVRHTGVDYLAHDPARRHLEGGEVRWDFEWTAPNDAGTVIFTAAAVAANDDASPLGDRVHTLKRTLSSE